MKHTLPALGALAALAGGAHADFLDGRVVDSNGVGIPNVNLDVQNLLGGGTPTISNDNSDANGYFHVTVPNGTYRVTLNPPPPPASTGLITEIASVTILGTANFGTVTINPGVTLTGHVVNPLGANVAGVNIDVIDPLGNNAALLYAQTNTLGNFSFNAPAGAIKFRLDPSTVSGQTLAPKEIPIVANSAYAFGTIQLAQGYVVSGIVRGPTGLAINGADADALDVITGVKLFTPGDSSSSTGFVDFVVPAGSWDLDFSPPTGMTLASKRFHAQPIVANTNLGVITLPAGIVLSGHVTDCNGVAVPGANVDVKDAVTKVEIAVTNDGADGAGNYSVYVPAGTWDVHVKPPFGVQLAIDVHYGIVVNAPTVVNGVLGPAYGLYCFGDGSGTGCPCGNVSVPGTNAGCMSSLGFGGRLTAVGAACVSADSAHLVGHDMGNSPALYFQGTAQQAGGAGLAFGDGLLCVGGTIIRLGVKFNVNGTSTFPESGDLPLSVGGFAAGGSSITYQAWYRDAVAFCSASNFNLTNGVQTRWAP